MKQKKESIPIAVALRNLQERILNKSPGGVYRGDSPGPHGNNPILFKKPEADIWGRIKR